MHQNISGIKSLYDKYYDSCFPSVQSLPNVLKYAQVILNYVLL